ncbi:MAG: peptide MFS transporter [bacterium]|nr:peptide MFS transporter [bacterium]
MSTEQTFMKKSVKYPIMYMAIYLAIQMFFLYNIILFGVYNLGKSNDWGSFIFAVVWGMGNILPIFIIKFSDKWGYKESLIVAGMLQLGGFYLMSLGSVTTLLVGASMFGASMVLAVAQNYVVMSNTMKKEYKGRFNIFLLSYALMNATSFVTGLISGFAPEIGYANVFRIGALCSAIILAYVLFFYNRAETFKGSQSWLMANRPKREKIIGFWKLLGIGIIATIVIYLLCMIAPLVNNIINLLVVCTILFVIFLAIKHKGLARKKIVVFLVLSIISMIFWTGYNMYTGTAYTAILDSATSLHGVSPQWALTMDPFVIILFGIFISILFMRLEKKGIHLNALMRILIGLFILSLGMFTVVFGFHAGDFAKINVAWMMLAIGICGFGEIFIGPVATAVAGQCATEGLEGVFIAIGFIIVGGTGATAALINEWMLNTGPTLLDKTHHISYVIGVFGLIALAGAIIMVILYKPMTKAAGFGRFKTAGKKFTRVAGSKKVGCVH